MRAPHASSVFQVAIECIVTDHAALAELAKELVDDLRQFGRVLAGGPGDRASFVDNQVFTNRDLGKDAGPKARFVVVQHGHADHSGVDHFKQIFSLQQLIGGLDLR